MSEEKPVTAVLAMAYGTPDTPEGIEPYFTDIRHGHPPSPEQLNELESRYERIGGVSPLYRITMRQVEGVQTALDIAAGPGAFRVFAGMKHWKPTIQESVQEIKDQGFERVVGLALAPHYSAFSVGEYAQKAEAAFGDAPARRSYVKSWCLEPFFLDHWANAVRTALDAHRISAEGTYFLFVAHSLPEAPILAANDPYPREIRASAEQIAARLGQPAGQWDAAYSSAGMTGAKWLGPDYTELFAPIRARGFSRVLVSSFGFVCDHLEVLYDVDIAGKGKAEQAGLALFRPQMPNDDAAFLAGLAAVVIREAARSAASVKRSEGKR